jgi:hypothetical protein
MDGLFRAELVIVVVLAVVVVAAVGSPHEGARPISEGTGPP